MADLGTYGETTEAEIHTFTYFGQVFTVSPEFGELDLMDWVERNAALDENSYEAVGEAKKLMQAAFVEYDEFWALAKKHRQGASEVMEVVMSVVEKIAARPTKGSSDSSDGPSATGPKSVPDLPKHILKLKKRLEDEGRPDLALAVLERAEAS